MRERSRIPVIIDTNALIMKIEYRIDFEDDLAGLLGGYEILIPTTVIHELRNVKDKHAKAALQYASRFRTIDSVNRGDEAILSLALKLHAVVVTNDRELRKRILAQGLRAAYIRQRSYLAMDIP